MECKLYACKQGLELELVGEDRLGSVSNLTRMLAERGISIEGIYIDIVRSDVSGKQTFKVDTHLLVPAILSAEALQKELRRPQYQSDDLQYRWLGM